MIVVSNTSPLHYLIAVERAVILAQLFTKIHVSPAVIEEMLHTSTPHGIRRWASNYPAWLTVDSLTRPVAADLVARLDRGEAEAIQLAEEKTADLIILDERNGRKIAQQRGLPLTGALGILGLAYQKQVLEDPLGVLGAMPIKGFRIHDHVVARFQVLLQTRYARQAT
jgi:predicted nucleic acid-binding protein